jgi:hypothetical protein
VGMPSVSAAYDSSSDDEDPNEEAPPTPH